VSGPERLELRVDDRAEVVARMDELARAGRGWINLWPAVDPDDEPPPRSVLGGLITARGPEVPLCTWTPESIGVQQATGPRTAARLASLGLAVPDGWRVTQDHPKRGLVLQVPADADHDRVLGWLLQAGTLLSAVTVGTAWRAQVHRL